MKAAHQRRANERRVIASNSKVTGEAAIGMPVRTRRAGEGRLLLHREIRAYHRHRVKAAHCARARFLHYIRYYAVVEIAEIPGFMRNRRPATHISPTKWPSRRRPKPPQPPPARRRVETAK